jgi:eukaryotic-like serine/threonine-protein kinase
MIGKILGHYQITSQLGKGGMGEVYQAKDQMLGRDVAIKVLPEEFAKDADRIARFQREAKVLASLNHPNIAAIYGLEESGGTNFLILELVEGETLADQIQRGPIPVEDSLKLALQIAEALEAAHEKGIIHRDLKPANIKVTAEGKVKVLDFGLAKAFSGEQADLNLSNSPTLSIAATQQGVILGTAAYMSPEQAKGKTVDKRADIWGFGCLLFEMLSGRSPFEGETISEVLARVLEREPDWSRLPAELSFDLVRLMRRCLEKNPSRRLHDIADARLELQDSRLEQPGSRDMPARQYRFRKAALWAFPVILSLACIAAVLLHWWFPIQSEPQPAQLQIELPAGVHLAVDTEHPTLALSPDGTQLVFVGDESGIRRLYLRRLADRDVRPIPGTEGAASPFFSPDGKWIGYYCGWSFCKVAVGGGIPMPVLASTPFGVNQGATWTADDKVVCALSVNSGLARASVAGDQMQPISDAAYMTQPTLPYAWPCALPGGTQVLFTDNSGPQPRIAVLKLQDGSITRLNIGGSNPRYSPSKHILFSRGGSLYSVPFDLKSVAVTGSEQKLVDGIMSQSSGAAQFSVASNGVMAYVAGSRVNTKEELVWVDRQGRTELLSDSRDTFGAPRFSPDGRELAVGSYEGQNLDIWRLDIQRGTWMRVTRHSGEDFTPVWSPDGKTLALASEIGEDYPNLQGPRLAWIAGNGVPELLLRLPNEYEFPSSWSPDGKWIAYLRIMTRSIISHDVMLLPVGTRQPIAFLEGPGNQFGAIFSPVGRWIAFVSDESNREEIYIAPFPGPGKKIQISTAGGSEPVWNRNGQEIFYRQGNKLMAVAFQGGSMETPGSPRMLFEGRFQSGDNAGSRTSNFDISPDGTRFVMVRRREPLSPTTIHIVFNWPKALGASDSAR